MKYRISFSLIAFAILLTQSAGAMEPGKALTFDRIVIDPEELFFPEDTKIRPDKSFLNLRNFRPMSNVHGERYAMVTVQNQLNSKQSLDPEEFVGVFADGTHRYPREFKVSIDPARTLTFALDFGTSRFPLVKVIINNG
ncbi:hypothetical protein [Rubellicoccus peritrichatus]|uniref:Uncharacterized protein n=1 Tax=Rubellicoccus peritrichatus TaxID=3080537 RepID=A0AAQ3LCD5_9BACT|nr:hypothetical protein [Puniceicoccus sp. CR14]WOO43085.1 hypothetical protein RZN69_08265 [Puniceicoccus sp. CR14]